MNGKEEQQSAPVTGGECGKKPEDTFRKVMYEWFARDGRSFVTAELALCLLKDAEDPKLYLKLMKEQLPYLFEFPKPKPSFSEVLQGETIPAGEEETVAKRYQGNPWYRRK